MLNLMKCHPLSLVLLRQKISFWPMPRRRKIVLTLVVAISVAVVFLVPTRIFLDRIKSKAFLAQLEVGAVHPRDVIGALSDALLDESDYAVRYKAAGYLEELGPEATEAIPALILALGDEGAFLGSNSDFVCTIAEWTLGRMGPAPVPE